MLSRKDFIKMSLEVNLFFQRIMKEHMIFMETAFPVIDSEYIIDANQLKRSFEELLSETVIFANGAVSNKVLKSDEIVTRFTLRAEQITQNLSGSCINTNITLAELKLTSDPKFDYTEWLESKVYSINERAINLVKEVINFKEDVLSRVLDCKMFTYLYPLLIDHILREARLYLETLKSLQKKTIPNDNIIEDTDFWNVIMKEHALFIRGLLDPTEDKLIKTANDFAELFKKIIEESIKDNEKNIVEKSLKATLGIKDFKAAGTEGLIQCKIRSIMVPLLGDHVLREANHYIRLLNSFRK
ncbi:DUF2935 domain-containing protein [Tissierella sp. MSJ-40]|uniref:DUF2935 domain-containing protein n=1 Tax=Tissierella simiarum TaxID=2841534 RepID=A0ABS6E0M4_9FIRM|nr:DUF2935 domain-containing protein [Tissierella simiarum]MBU5436445.1 DUF2935 domain-containing protein [Tissierella simiarum]